MAVFLLPDLAVWIAKHLGFQHLGLLCRTSRALHAIVSPSWDVWTSSAQKVWGASAPWDVGRMRTPDETPLQFARRMVCPWVHPPREIALELPYVQDAQGIRAWRIQLDEQRHPQITFKFVLPGGAFGYEGFPGQFDIVRGLPSPHPLADAVTVAPLSDDERDEWDEYLLTFQPTVDDTPGDVYRYDNFGDSCWRLHAGVVVAAYSYYWDTGSALCFFSVRDRRLLHFHTLPEEIGVSCELLIACPGEMWILERYVRPESQLVYYGMQGV